MSSLLIAHGRIVDPTQHLDALRDLRIVDGRVAEIGEHLTARSGEEIFDAAAAMVAPGFIDMHVHLRQPGFPEKETLESGMLAALRGGFTAVAGMPNTRPALDDPAVLRALARRVRDARGPKCRVYPVAAITRERRGEATLDYAALRDAGAAAFSDDGNTVMNARVLREAAQRARNVAGVFISHAEDELLKGDGVMHEGAVSRALQLPGAPALAEETVVARDLLIARETGKPWHIAHLSTRAALAMTNAAKANAVGVTCEVTAHHLFFTDEAVRELGAAAKVSPPLRTQGDVRALCDAVRAGEIDVFASDHAPHTAAEKSGDIHTAAVGFTGLEIAVGAYALAVPDLPFARFVTMLSCNPARILGVQGGTLAVGAVGDVTIFADRPWRVDPSQFASKGKCTPFAGLILPRRPIATIVAGEIMSKQMVLSP